MKKIITFFCTSFLYAASFAQVQSNFEKAEFDADNKPTFAQFKNSSSYSIANVRNILSEALLLQQNDTLIEKTKTTDELGFNHIKYQQYFKNIKVEYGDYSVHAKNDRITVINGEFKTIDQDLSTVPALTESVALNKAIKFVGAQEYVWNNADAPIYYSKINGAYLPKAELVIINNYADKNAAPSNRYILAYKFDIYASMPLSRQYVYVHAQTGEIVHTNSIIKHANSPGTADTRYSGSQSITTDSYQGGYRLREIRGTGLGIETYNMKKGTNYAKAVDFSDANNKWSAGEYNNANFDNAALDAHWGSEKVYDYWKNIHNRNSYDDAGTKLKSYVHYSNSYDNAFWNGSVMTYGDGSGNYFTPLTAIDVCGHEIGHAVCESTCGLVYENESGAINEALSDIWGACVENYAAPNKQIWLIGEEIDARPNHIALRSMSNPNAEGQPDTYKGTNWDAVNEEVHTNSGVLNYCFYLMCVGGNGTNDIGNKFSVTGISIAKAEKIVFRAEKQYMNANTNYNGARTAFIQAATDLYGANSLETFTTMNAFYAVGIGSCVDHFTINTPQNTTIKYEVSNYITGTSTITTKAGQSIIFDAGKYVLLQPGFLTNTSAGGYFSAYIDGCGGKFLVNPNPFPVQNSVSSNIADDGTNVLAITKTPLEVYPTPFTNNLTINFYLANNNKKASVDVYSITGVRMKNLLNENKPISGRRSIQWNSNPLPAGTYLIVLTTDAGKEVKRVVKF